jgi:hypothetical protein
MTSSLPQATFVPYKGPAFALPAIPTRNVLAELVHVTRWNAKPRPRKETGLYSTHLPNDAWCGELRDLWKFLEPGDECSPLVVHYGVDLSKSMHIRQFARKCSLLTKKAWVRAGGEGVKKYIA